MSNNEGKVIRRGQVFKCPDYGLVEFKWLDYHHGECTAMLKGIDNPGMHFPRIDFLIEHGFTVIDK